MSFFYLSPCLLKEEEEGEDKNFIYLIVGFIFLEVVIFLFYYFIQ